MLRSTNLKPMGSRSEFNPLGRGRSKRTIIEFNVLVLRTDATGKCVSEPARTSDVAPRGARLSGLTGDFKPGEEITVQHGEHSARFRVVWFRDLGERGKEAGVELLEPDTNIWCTGSGSLEDGFLRCTIYASGPGSRLKLAGNITDLSATSCYVECSSQFPIGCRVELWLSAGAGGESRTGEVKVVNPGRGMGIDFTSEPLSL